MENLQAVLTFYLERIITGLMLFILFLMLLPTIIKIVKPFFITLVIKLFKIDLSEIEKESDSIENLIEKTGEINETRKKYFREILESLAYLELKSCKKEPNKYHSVKGIRYSGKLNSEKTYVFHDYITDLELIMVKEYFSKKNYKLKFEWFSSSWDITKVGEQKGLKISLCYPVSI